GGFTRASEKMHVSHSAISRQIKLLEDELGVPLFVRANKQIRLTAGGRALLPYVDSVFAQLQEAVQRVGQSMRKTTRQLRIGTGSTMLNLFLPAVLKEFQEQYPDVKLLIKTGHAANILKDIRSRELDLGVVSLPIGAEDLQVIPLYREELVLAIRGRERFGSRKFISPHELEPLPLIIFSSGSSTRAVLDGFFEQAGVTPSIQLEVENDEAAERAVLNGAGASFLPIGRVTHVRIHYVRIQGHQIVREIALVCPHGQSTCASAFLTLCRGHAACAGSAA